MAGPSECVAGVVDQDGVQCVLAGASCESGGGRGARLRGSGAPQPSRPADRVSSCSLGLLVPGISVPALVGRLTARWVGWFGLAVAVLCELASLSAATGALTPLLPIGRFATMAWLLAVAVTLPAQPSPARRGGDDGYLSRSGRAGRHGYRRIPWHRRRRRRPTRRTRGVSRRRRSRRSGDRSGRGRHPGRRRPGGPRAR